MAYIDQGRHISISTLMSEGPVQANPQPEPAAGTLADGTIFREANTAAPERQTAAPKSLLSKISSFLDFMTCGVFTKSRALEPGPVAQVTNLPKQEARQMDAVQLNLAPVVIQRDPIQNMLPVDDLGPNTVDVWDMINASPTLRSQLEQLGDDGWNVKVNPDPRVANGEIDEDDKTIFVSQSAVDFGATEVIHQIADRAAIATKLDILNRGLPANQTTKENYVDQKLAEDGLAILNVMTVHAEILQKGGPGLRASTDADVTEIFDQFMDEQNQILLEEQRGMPRIVSENMLKETYALKLGEEFGSTTTTVVVNNKEEMVTQKEFYEMQYDYLTMEI